jgi:hypothetical protein
LKNTLAQKTTTSTIKDGKRLIAKYKATISTIILITLSRETIPIKTVIKNMKLKIPQAYRTMEND